jgi:hypothetical protein
VNTLELKHLVDVSDTLAPTTDDFLKFDGTSWNSAPKPTYTLDELTTVTAPAPANNDILLYN